MQMRDSQAVVILQRLAQDRSRVGDTAFKTIASQLLDEASLRALSELLDQHEPQPT